MTANNHDQKYACISASYPLYFKCPKAMRLERTGKQWKRKLNLKVLITKPKLKL